jgi:hypothetical protein
MNRLRAGACAAAALLCAACTGNAEKSKTVAPRATPALIANPTDFALGADAKILDAKPFNQKITNSQGAGGTLMSQGIGTYHGHSVIAQSTAPLADVKAWLSRTEAAPPAGYEYVTKAEKPNAVALAAKYGVTYAVFKRGAKGAVIAVIDPKLAHDKLGFMLSLVDKFRMLPSGMRDPIDQETKKQTGISVTEALDPSAPIGMTIEALREVNGSSNPAIVEVDAEKE